MILNKDRVRVIAHQWRYLALSIAMIAALTLLLILSRGGKITAQQGANNSDEHFLIGMVRQVAEGIPRQLNSGGSPPIPNLEFKDFAGKTGEPMWQKFDGFVVQRLTTTRVEVGDFHVNIIGDKATIDFLGTIYFKESDRGEEKSTADRYTVEMVKANGEWQALPPPPPPPQRTPPPKPADSAQNEDAAPTLPPQSGQMTVESGRTLKSLRGHKDGNSVIALLREAAYDDIRHNTSFFVRVHDAQYFVGDLESEKRKRAGETADVKRLGYAIKKFEFDDLRVSGNESWAFATFLGRVYFQANGQDSTAQYRYTVNFINWYGQWKISAIHASRKQ